MSESTLRDVRDGEGIPRKARPGDDGRRRLFLVVVLTAAGAAVLAWPVTHFFGLARPAAPRALFEFPGVEWLAVDYIPGSLGRFNLVVNVRAPELSFGLDDARHFLRRLVEEAQKECAHYNVRIYGPGEKLLMEIWSDADASHVNVKPGDVPLKGPADVKGMLWLAVGTIVGPGESKPRAEFSVKFEEPEVVSVPYVESVLAYVKRQTAGEYSEYYLHVYDRRDRLILETLSEANSGRYRSLPTDDYFNQ